MAFIFSNDLKCLKWLNWMALSLTLMDTKTLLLQKLMYILCLSQFLYIWNWHFHLLNSQHWHLKFFLEILILYFVFYALLIYIVSDFWTVGFFGLFGFSLFHNLCLKIIYFYFLKFKYPLSHLFWPFVYAFWSFFCKYCSIKFIPCTWWLEMLYIFNILSRFRYDFVQRNNMIFFLGKDYLFTYFNTCNLNEPLLQKLLLFLFSHLKLFRLFYFDTRCVINIW